MLYLNSLIGPGYGASCDAYHITSPDPEGDGLRRALLQALHDGGIRAEEVDYVNAHGTSTQKNDEFETVAYKAAFGRWSKINVILVNLTLTGDHAYKMKISSIKVRTCDYTVFL